MGPNHIINIAKGTYKPTSGTQRGKSFELQTAVRLLGGFPNGGGERSPETNLTILSGEIDNIGGSAGNSFHVVKVVNADNVMLDGLHIKDGNAGDSSSFGRSRGGGVFCNGASVDMKNVVIRRNSAIYGGGIFATLSPDVTIRESEIILNTADYGSAVYHSNETNLYLSKVQVVDNNSLVRCAIEVNNSLSTDIRNSVIANNASTNTNAIAFIATNRNQSCTIRSSTILGADKNKNLLTFQVGFGDQLDVDIYNSIIAHQNLNFDKNVKEFNNGTFNFNHYNCYFQGSDVIGTGYNTLFSDIDGDMLLNADYSLDNCSPLVNAGDNSGNADTFSDSDIAGNNREIGVLDIGAYEAQGTCSALAREITSNTEFYADNIDEKKTRVKQNTNVLFPNPTNGKAWISNYNEEIQISIFDQLGRKIQNIQQGNEIDLAQESNGIYFVHIYSEGELIKVEKIIKQ